MAENDPLDGYRAPLSAVARHVERANDNDSLWQRLYLGDAASRMMRGVAKREDISKVMAMMIAQCELDTQASCQQILDCTDLSDPKARKAHFDARVSAGILGRLNQYINDGERAGEVINSQGDVA
jgi:hypothetical protein